MSLKRREVLGLGMAGMALAVSSGTAFSAAAQAASSVAKTVGGVGPIQSKMNVNFAAKASPDPALMIAKAVKSGATRMNWADPQRADPPVNKPLVSPAIIEATRQALDSGKTFYSYPSGMLEFRQAIAKKLREFNGIEVDPGREIIVTPGSDNGLYYAIRVLLNDGDEVLNPEPSYGVNFRAVALCGGKSISVPLHESEGFDLNIEEFEKRVTSRTKAVVLTNPNNPTGKVYSREILEKFSKFVVKHDLFVVSDQAFEGSVFDGREFVTVASLPGMWERTITTFSLSKGHGVSGYRVGYNVACAEIMEVMYGSAVNIIGATNTLAQYGAMAGINEDGPGTRFNEIYDRRRKRAYRLLNEVPGVRCLMPEATFMIWVNVSELGSSEEIVAYLIDDAKVITNQYTASQSLGEGYIRIVLGSVVEEEIFEDGLDRLVSALSKRAREKNVHA